MTAIDKSKLQRIITQCGSQDDMEMVRAVWNAAQAEEREECAKLLVEVTKESWRWAVAGLEDTCYEPPTKEIPDHCIELVLMNAKNLLC